MTQAMGRTALELFGEGSAPPTTKDRLICTALDLFYTYGFHAVGLDRIIAEVGVTKTTFYNHFESKDDLIIAAIRLRDEWEAAAFVRRVHERAGDDPARQLVAMFDVLDDYFNLPEYQGCLYINACAEFPALHDPVHEAAAKHYLVSQQHMTKLAEQAGARDPEHLGLLLIMLLEGAVAQRFIAGDNSTAAAAREVVVLLLRQRGIDIDSNESAMPAR